MNPSDRRPSTGTGDLASGTPRAEMRRLTRRSFATAGIAAFGGLSGLAWLNSTELDSGTPWPLRRVFEFNERLSRGFFSSGRLAPEFPRELAQMPRANGGFGLADDVADDWRLEVTTEAVGVAPLSLTLAEVQRLPNVEMTTELKCIEGWSEIVHWTGARLIDFARQYRLARRSGVPWVDDRADDLLDFVGLETPDAAYYVGIDMPSALHAQTLLCWAMNGEPLSANHGAPLRLVIPLKYGIKHIKRIGRIFFTDQQPRDYWAERGYDWYSGH